MRNNKFLIIPLLLIVLCFNAVGQTRSYPFEVHKTGQGDQSILFIPGFASSGEVWDTTKSKFEKEYTCYTLTMAGFAGVQPQSNSTFILWENAIANYIIDQNIKKPIVVGHSMGGVLAMAIASDYPDLLAKIVVVDALPCLSALMDSTFKVKENNDCSAIENQLLSLTEEQFYQMQKMSISRLIENQSMQETVVNWSLKSDRKTFASMYCDFSNTDLRDKIKFIKCPSLILLESYFINLKPTIETQYESLPNANLQYATKGLHFIMYDDKEWYFSQLTNFILVP